MEPYEALRSLEVALRLIIRLKLQGWTEARGAPDIDALRVKRDAERSKRTGVQVPEDLLDYTDSRQLHELIIQNWETFADVFKKKARIENYFSLVERVRNSIAHSRDIAPFEADLMSGVSGYLRNLIAMHRGQASPSAPFYPLIEQVTDNFGSVGAPINAFLSSLGPRLNVGDILTFRASATAARALPVKWAIEVESAQTRWYSEDLGVGDEITLTLPIEPFHVSESILVRVMITTDSAYHRHITPSRRQYDDFAQFRYAVNPPWEG